METITLMFDYLSKIDDQETRDFAQEKALLVKGILKRASQSVCEVGQILIETKSRLGHGNFIEWVSIEFGMTDRHARRFMQVAEAFGKSDIMSDLPLPNTALFALASPSVSDETRTLALEKAAAGEIKTTREVQTFVEERKEIEALPAIRESGSTTPGFHINVPETQNYVQAKADKEKQLRELSTPEDALRFFLENETYLTGQPEFLSIWKRRARRAIAG